VWLPDGEKTCEDIMFICFDRIHEYDSVTDGQTDGQTPHNGIDRAYRAAKMNKNFEKTSKHLAK